MSTSRERMLANIRKSLDQNRAGLEAEARRAPHAPPPFVHPPEDDLPAQFVTELARLEGHPHRCADDEAALEVIQSILQTHAATSVLAWDLDEIGLRGLDALLGELGVAAHNGQVAYSGDERAVRLQELEPVPVCISGADVGIAESGTLVVRGGAGRGRLASLLAPVHIAVLRTPHVRREQQPDADHRPQPHRRHRADADAGGAWAARGACGADRLGAWGFHRET
jgi:L-lactate dehydrogenase complex protein LldG